MKQEDKDLLLKDLCGRLPYGVKVKYAIPTLLVSVKNPTLLVSVRNDSDGIKVITEDTYIKYIYNIEDIKPYLRPMESMTDEEEKEYINIDNRSYTCPMIYAHIPALERIDWLNAHHFDYRGLIEKGLALEAPEGMYNHYKE